MASPAGGPVDDDLFDQDESWDGPPRTNRLTVVLVVALLVVAGFVGGVVAQKHHDAGLSSTAAALRNRAGGAGGTRNGSGTGATDRGREGGAGPTSDSAAPAAPVDPGAPVVVGTVAAIAGSTVTVTDTAGTEVTVVVPPTAPVTTPGLGGLTVGAPVSVTGSRSAAGTVTAATLTSRGTDG
jgi:hypothetical protein